MAYSNGKYPQSGLYKVQDAGGGYHTEYLRKDAADNFLKMRDDAARQGVTIKLRDGYRSYSEQVYLANKYGLYSRGGLAAYPGTSNHGHGIAIDVDDYDNARYWVARYGYRYGWKGPLPREPWHFDCASPGLTFRFLQECPFDTLNPGARGGDVRLLEARLGARIDGTYNPAAQRQVIAYQRASGLKADGVVGPTTWLKLLRGSYRLPTLKRGAGGNNRNGVFVKMLKRRLVDLGYKTLVMNDKFGVGTGLAVKQFQRRKGLKADGVVGPRTWKELFW